MHLGSLFQKDFDKLPIFCQPLEVLAGRLYQASDPFLKERNRAQ